MTNLTEEVALSVIQSVLARHGIAADDNWEDGAPPEWLDNLIICLCDAEVDEAVSVSLERVRKKRHKVRLERISLIEDLLSTFRDAGGRIQTRKWLRDRHSIDLDSLLRDLRALMRAEKMIDATQPHAPTGGRPPMAKNESAENMFWILCEAGFVERNKSGAWTGSEIIAEMLVDACIEKRPLEKVRASLNDKIARQLR